MMLRRIEPAQGLLRLRSAGDHQNACGYNRQKPEEVHGFYSADHRLLLSVGDSPFKACHFPSIASFFYLHTLLKSRKFPAFLKVNPR
jgi:hypothetical protein